MIVLLKLILVILGLGLYALIAAWLLPRFKVPRSPINIATFVMSGAVIGVMVMVTIGAQLMGQEGHIGEAPLILGTLVVSFVAALMVSILLTKSLSRRYD